MLPIGGPGEAMTALQQGQMLFDILGKEPKFVKVGFFRGEFDPRRARAAFKPLSSRIAPRHRIFGRAGSAEASAARENSGEESSGAGIFRRRFGSTGA